MYIKLVDSARRSSKRERISGLLCGSSPNSWIMQQLELAERSRSPDPVWHIVISERDRTARNTVEERRKLVHALMAELGLSDHQAVWALHEDTAHPHLHLVINRVDPLTETLTEINNGWHIKALKQALHRVLRKLDYTVSPDMPRYDGKGKRLNPRPRKALSQQAQRFERYHGLASAERLARTRLAPLAETAGSWAELHALFRKKGATFKRKGRGLVIMLEGQAVKASAMGRAFSRAALEKRFGAFEEETSSRPPERADTLFARWKDSEARKERQRRAWYSERNRLYRLTLSKRLAGIRAWQKRERQQIHDVARAYGRADLLSLCLLLESQAAFRRATARDQARLWKQQQILPETLQRLSWVRYREERAMRHDGLRGKQVWTGSLFPERSRHQSLLEQYRPVMSPAGYGIHYVKANRETAFTDRGQQILATKHMTDEDVLAMLRLAEERYPRGFTLQGSEQWKARATRIARENGISLEGWHQGRRPRPGVRDRERALQQAEREGKPAYMDLAFWKSLPEAWQEQEREQRLYEEERKRELSPNAYARWLAEEQFGPRLRYEFDRSCRRITDHPDDPTAQKAFREAERRMEAFRNGELTYEGWKTREGKRPVSGPPPAGRPPSPFDRSP